jgi:hypothetical protein
MNVEIEIEIANSLDDIAPKKYQSLKSTKVSKKLFLASAQK